MPPKHEFKSRHQNVKIKTPMDHQYWSVKGKNDLIISIPDLKTVNNETEEFKINIYNPATKDVKILQCEMRGREDIYVFAQLNPSIPSRSVVEQGVIKNNGNIEFGSGNVWSPTNPPANIQKISYTVQSPQQSNMSQSPQQSNTKQLQTTQMGVIQTPQTRIVQTPNSMITQASKNQPQVNIPSQSQNINPMISSVNPNGPNLNPNGPNLNPDMVRI